MPPQFLNHPQVVAVLSSPSTRRPDPQHVTVEEQERAQRLVLRRGRDLTIHGEMGEELPDFFYSHLRRVALPVEENEPPDPVRVSLLGSQAQVAEARDGADAFEESGLLHGDGCAGKKSVESSGWAGHYTRGESAAG